MLAGYMLTCKTSNNKMLSSDISWPMIHTLWQIYLVAYVWYIKILTDSEAFRSKLQIFQESIVPQFPEETWAQRKPN